VRRCDILLLLALAATGCNAPPLAADARVAAIEAGMSRLRRDTATVLGLSAEGATLEAAYEGMHLRRLRAEYLGETGRAVDVFYFDSAAFFVVRKEYRYDAPLSGRVVDSMVLTFDLTRTGVPGAQADSLKAAARLLLQRIQHPDG
jgi:hypothetical protein